MIFIDGIDALRAQHRPSAVSIGNFDGVHRGHQRVVSTLLAESQRLGVPATVVTFEPLAREYFAPKSVARLSTSSEKAALLFDLGVDQVLSIRFDHSLAQQSPQQFIQSVLIEGLGTRFLSVGDDFRFGHQRAGDFQTLTQAGQTAGFNVQRHTTVLHAGDRVSSGRIRTALQQDDLALAFALLGRDFSISGPVAMGQQLGRTLSFPTANIELGERVVPVSGVYAVTVSGQAFSTAGHGVANVGMRPTVNGQAQRLEVHLFDFAEDIYGQHITVHFKHKIRGEQRFDSLDALKAQIANDVIQAKEWLSEHNRGWL